MNLELYLELGYTLDQALELLNHRTFVQLINL